MDTLDKVELIREKCNVSYQDAKEALDACNDDVLDAIIWLEKAGKADTRTASYETSGSDSASQVTSTEMRKAQEDYQQHSRKTRFEETWARFCAQVKRVVRAGIEMTFIAEHNGKQSISCPLIIVVIGMLAWGASIWLMIIGLFLGWRYRIEGASPITIDVNDAMDKAADTAESIKSDFAKSE